MHWYVFWDLLSLGFSNTFKSLVALSDIQRCGLILLKQKCIQLVTGIIELRLLPSVYLLFNSHSSTKITRKMTERRYL